MCVDWQIQQEWYKKTFLKDLGYKNNLSLHYLFSVSYFPPKQDKALDKKMFVTSPYQDWQHVHGDLATHDKLE